MLTDAFASVAVTLLIIVEHLRMSRCADAVNVRMTAGVHLLLDVAHTAQSAAGLVRVVSQLRKPAQRVMLIVGVASDKAASEIVTALLDLPIAHVACVNARIWGAQTRGYSAARLADTFRQQIDAGSESAASHSRDAQLAALRVDALTAPEGANPLVDAMALVLAQPFDQSVQDAPLVVVTGSTYVVADALRIIAAS